MQKTSKQLLKIRFVRKTFFSIHDRHFFTFKLNIYNLLKNLLEDKFFMKDVAVSIDQF